ncbi:MAG: lytic murein transglycosylase [Cardiobacteriaceae bacterium]|nr:lytic murein transglycosylase [Cardiobacteriaceae bacterium]
MIYHRILIGGILPGMLWACAASTSPYPASPSPETGQMPQPPVNPANFADWKAHFRARAIAHGIAPETVDRLLVDAQESESVLRLDRKQPEFSKMIWSYLDSAVADKRVRDGRRHFQAEHVLLQGLQAHYGVPAEIIAAIWGMETSYGANTGSSHLPSALSTLAYDGRRREFAEKQLLALMQLLEKGDVRWDQLVGSWAGGMGQTQFIPTTYWDNAVDGNGDGVRNLWDRADALASTANYLSRSGWQAGLPWGYEVVLPQAFDFAALGQTLTFSQWQQYGLLLADGRRLPGSAAQAKLWLPAGHQGPAFLLTKNFDVIRVYNNSSSYALGIGLLGDAIAGRAGLQAAWPRAAQPLSREQVIRLQTRLTAQGFDTQGTDGVLGEKTREAFRHWQAANGQVPDGFVSLDNAQPLLGGQ